MPSRFSRRGLKVGVFVDNVNLFLAVKDRFGATPSHAAILREAVADNTLHRAILYSVRHDEEKMDRWKEVMAKYGFEVREKIPVNHKADWDLGIVIDVWRMIDALDMVVIISGDADFVPLVERCHELGKIVRVMGVPGRIAHELTAVADEFTPIDQSLLLTEGKDSKDAAGN